MDADLTRLTELITPMDLPDCNRDLSNLRNILWLGRNMFIRNGDHPNFQEASKLLTKVTREKLGYSKH